MRKATAAVSALLILILLLSACQTVPRGPDVQPPSPDVTESTPPAVTPDDPVTPTVTLPPDETPPPETPPPDEPDPPDEPAPPAEPDPPDEPDPPVKPDPPVEPDPPAEPSPPPPETPSLRAKPTAISPTKSGAESTVSVLYTNLAAGMSWGQVWDNYVYSGSKSRGYTRSSFVSQKEEFQRSYDFRYIGITVLSSEERKPGVYLVNGLLEYERGGEKIAEEGADYVIFENGEFYISLSGALLNAAYTRCVSTFPNISCLDAVVCEYDDRTTVECTLYNLSETDYHLGSAGSLPVTVWQDGKGTTIDCSPGLIGAGGYYALSFELPGYRGMPEKITLDNVSEPAGATNGDGTGYSMDILLFY